MIDETWIPVYSDTRVYFVRDVFMLLPRDNLDYIFFMGDTLPVIHI